MSVADACVLPSQHGGVLLETVLGTGSEGRRLMAEPIGVRTVWVVSGPDRSGRVFVCFNPCGSCVEEEVLRNNYGLEPPFAS